MSPDDIWAQIKGNEEKQKDTGKDEVGKRGIVYGKVMDSAAA